tara:strand:+ start:578 stop:697 length:120 start_codon:yes stop_codon:yes gene_type:complete
MELNVHSVNLEARAFYLHVGFREVQEGDGIVVCRRKIRA